MVQIRFPDERTYLHISIREDQQRLSRSTARFLLFRIEPFNHCGTTLYSVSVLMLHLRVVDRYMYLLLEVEPSFLLW